MRTTAKNILLISVMLFLALAMCSFAYAQSCNPQYIAPPTNLLIKELCSSDPGLAAFNIPAGTPTCYAEFLQSINHQFVEGQSYSFIVALKNQWAVDNLIILKNIGASLSYGANYCNAYSLPVPTLSSYNIQSVKDEYQISKKFVIAKPGDQGDVILLEYSFTFPQGSQTPLGGCPTFYSGISGEGVLESYYYSTPAVNVISTPNTDRFVIQNYLTTAVVSTDYDRTKLYTPGEVINLVYEVQNTHSSFSFYHSSPNLYYLPIENCGGILPMTYGNAQCTYTTVQGTDLQVGYLDPQEKIRITCSMPITTGGGISRIINSFGVSYNQGVCNSGMNIQPFSNPYFAIDGAPYCVNILHPQTLRTLDQGYFINPLVGLRYEDIDVKTWVNSILNLGYEPALLQFNFTTSAGIITQEVTIDNGALFFEPTHGDSEIKDIQFPMDLFANVNQGYYPMSVAVLDSDNNPVSMQAATYKICLQDGISCTSSGQCCSNYCNERIDKCDAIGGFYRYDDTDKLFKRTYTNAAHRTYSNGPNAIDGLEVDIGDDGSQEYISSFSIQDTIKIQNQQIIDAANSYIDSNPTCLAMNDWENCTIPIRVRADSGIAKIHDLVFLYTNYYWNTTLYPNNELSRMFVQSKQSTKDRIITGLGGNDQSTGDFTICHPSLDNPCPIITECSDLIDNLDDEDTLIDCQDPGCWFIDQNGEYVCNPIDDNENDTCVVLDGICDSLTGEDCNCIECNDLQDSCTDIYPTPEICVYENTIYNDDPADDCNTCPTLPELEFNPGIITIGAPLSCNITIPSSEYDLGQILSYNYTFLLNDLEVYSVMTDELGVTLPSSIAVTSSDEIRCEVAPYDGIDMCYNTSITGTYGATTDITGYVWNQTEGNPLPDSLVIIYLPSQFGLHNVSAISGIDGSYSLLGVPYNMGIEYNIIASHLGFMNEVKKIIMPVSEPVNFTLFPFQSECEADCTLREDEVCHMSICVGVNSCQPITNPQVQTQNGLISFCENRSVNTYAQINATHIIECCSGFSYEIGTQTNIAIPDANNIARTTRIVTDRGKVMRLNYLVFN